MSWTSETIYDDGDQYFSALKQGIDAAKKSISFESYIFSRDAIGDAIINHLEAATRRGVDVRLLVDGFGCVEWTLNDVETLRQRGIPTRIYHPFPWQNHRWTLSFFFRPQRWMARVIRLNRRNHRKTCVIDDSVVFLGGLNISALHSRAESKEEAWRDTGVRLEGSEVAPVVEAFNEAWKDQHERPRFLRFQREAWAPPGAIRLNWTRKRRVAAYNDLIQRVREAKTRIWLTNSYFVPEVSLLRAIVHAARHGVDVRIIVPHKSDIMTVKWAISALYVVLLTSGARIFEYESSILHAKTVVIDDWVTVGSTNFNFRSLRQNLEIDAVLSQPRSIETLKAQFIEDVAQSREIDLRTWDRRSYFSRLLERMALLFYRRF